jgi:release factor glutamine methyltransferase
MTLSALLSSTRQSLRRSGAAHPDVEAELILAHVLGLKRAQLYLDPARAIAPGDETRVAEILVARGRRYPLQYLLGEIEFMGLPLIVREGVFIPRPETEILVEILIERGRALGPPLAILDLCTGSGAIAVSLAKYLETSVVLATDVSLAAVRLARENAVLNGVEARLGFAVADGLKPLGRSRARFDIVVSNPPYIPTGEISGLQPEVRDFEPQLALDGGEDGLGFVAEVMGEIPSILGKPGIVAFEIGATQAEAASALFAQAGLGEIEIAKDLAGRDRVIIGRRKLEAGA